MIFQVKVDEKGTITIPEKSRRYYAGKDVYAELIVIDKRTESQNNTFWLRNRLLANASGENTGRLYPPEQIADLVKILAIGYEDISIGEYQAQVPASSKDLPIHRFSDLIQFQDLLARELGVILPEVDPARKKR